ncbi:2-phosphoxylose phosphatase 1 [Entomophthora muscae]|uniref:2-phosphoxylose phosphatase 1 n=1 Tax=Entomophthora muscae TaxID=34485 RepID=A0ACC2S4N3_9FUNG|nr:2-phosphoxylose phosphatase 1 [Entomophthora muscae]
MSSSEDIKFEEDGVCSEEHLTNKGIQQLAQLGEELRQIYKAQLTDGVFVNATWTQRTYWSAVALMSGLLNSKNPKFVIHSKPIEKDGLIHLYNKCKLEKQLTRGLVKTNEFQLANASLVKVAKDHGLGVSSHSLAAYKAVDNLRCLDCHQMSLPPSKSDKSAIYEAMDEFTKAVYFPASRNAQFHRMHIGTYLKDLNQQLQHTRKEAKPRFFYTSAHDASVSALLSSLDIGITGTPPYASNFIIELWVKKRARSDDHKVVRFIYNGEYVKPSWCKGKYCSYKELRFHLNILGIHLAGTSKGLKEFDFWSECNAQQEQLVTAQMSTLCRHGHCQLKT